MIDWSEGHHALKNLTHQLYEAMLSGQFDKARKICDEMIIEARLTKAKIGAQSDDQQGS
jgi:molecular chaperone DnaK (HSP70)